MKCPDCNNHLGLVKKDDRVVCYNSCGFDLSVEEFRTKYIIPKFENLSAVAVSTDVDVTTLHCKRSSIFNCPDKWDKLIDCKQYSCDFYV